MAAILVVEDDELVRQAIGRVLALERHEVITVENGRLALEVLDRRPFDLVITDLIMPEKEGLETITELRHRHPGLKVIAVSGGGRTGLRHYLDLAEKLGARASLAKPFTRGALVGAVNHVLAIQP
jgi:DNA-binding NtrC family response regulator